MLSFSVQATTASGQNHTFESGRSADERPKTDLIRRYQVLDSNH